VAQVHLHEAAKAASRSKGTYLSAQYRAAPAPTRPRKGHGRRRAASILAAAYPLLDRAGLNTDLGADWFLRRHDPQRHARTLARQIEAFGFHVTIEPSEAA
jgi:hypothetical protein